MILNAENLSISRSGLPIIEGLNFSLSSGDILKVIGQNGVGKTTLLRTIAGLQPIYHGSIDVEDDNIVYSAHSNGMKSALTVTENLKFWADIYGSSDIRDALLSFDLIKLKDRYAGRLSAGQKRRLSLARLVLSQKRLWILDEPTTSLDQKSISYFTQALEHHIERGGAAIIATHLEINILSKTINLNSFKAKPRSDEHRLDAFDEAFL